MGRERMSYSWMEDDYAKQWLNGIKKQSQRVYRNEFNQWMMFIKISPTDQIKSRINDLQSTNPKERNRFEDAVLEFKRMLEIQGYTGKTLSNKLTPIRAFFTCHRVQLHFRRGELVGKNPTTKQILKFAPNNIEIRAMHNVASVRDRAVLTFLYHTGFSGVDVLKQNIGDIIDGFRNEDEHFVIQTHRSKTGVAHVTCLSYEALYDIKSMLKERGLNIKEILENPDHEDREQPLFMTHKGERLDTRFLNDAIKKLADKALAPERASQFKTKSLRDSYNTALLEAEIQQEIKDILFGHMRLDARGNYAFTEEIIRQAYLKAFKKMSINGHRQTKKAIEQLEAKFDTNLEVMSAKIAKQQKQIDEIIANYQTLEGKYHELVLDIENKEKFEVSKRA